MPTPKKTTNKPTPKIISDEVEVNFVVAFGDNGECEVYTVNEEGDYLQALDNCYFDYTSFRVCRVYLPRPKPQEPLVLVPQIG
jgi:hypothetical protein